MSDNADNLKIFDEIATRGYYLDPNLDPQKGDPSDIIIGMRESREMARLTVLQSRSLYIAGKYEESFNQAEKLILFGARMAKSQPSLVQFLVGLAIRNMGADQANKIVDGNILDSSQLSNQFLAQKKTELDQYASLNDGLKQSLKMEYMFSSNLFRNMVSDPESLGPIPTDLLSKVVLRQNFYFKLNKTIKLNADAITQMIGQVDQTCNYVENKFNVSIPEGPDSGLFGGGFDPRYIFTENAIGIGIVKEIPKGIANTLQKKCDSDEKMTQLLGRLGK